MLWALICALLFVAMLFILFFCYVFIFLVFSDRRAPHLAHGVSRVWAFLIHTLFLIPLRVKHRAYIDPEKTYVFIANHRSQLDIPAFAAATKNTFRFLAKAELTKIPLMGWIIKKLYLTVDRKDRQDRNKSIEAMKRSLDKGISVFICPEGTRNRKDEPVVMDFRDGAFRLAVATKTPLAVLVLYNTAEHLSPNRPFELVPGIIRGEWLEPIDTSSMTMDDVPQLKERVRAIMEEKIRAYRAAKNMGR